MSLSRKHSRAVLWIVQSVLAALFLFAGGAKLAAPAGDLAKMSTLSPAFLKFIGTCEILGALGLVLPGIFRVRLGLTPLAATGLVLIMAGAVVVTAMTQNVSSALFPLGIGGLAALVAIGRRAPAIRGAWSAPSILDPSSR